MCSFCCQSEVSPPRTDMVSDGRVSTPPTTPDQWDATHLGEVTHNVCPLLVDFSEDVENKRLHVKIQRLVVEEEFC